VDAKVLAAARALMTPGRRRVLGIAGKPGAGKSTLAAALAERLGAAACVVPMDGFHLSNRQLAQLGRAQRKGAPDTFDTHGYRALLERLVRRDPDDSVIYAPGFYREIEEPIAASLRIDAGIELVITEGNYLLLPDPPCPAVRERLAEVLTLEVGTDQREQWLLARHIRFGRSEAEARAWMAATDRPNAERIGAASGSADRYLCWQGERMVFSCG
jgi:pantothenate kinase